MSAMSGRAGKQVVLIAIVIAVALGAMAAGAVLGPKILGQGKSAKDGAKPGHGKKADKHGKQAEKTKDHSDEEDHKPIIVSLGDFLVNINSSGGVRYLRAEVALGLLGLPEPKAGGHGGGAKGPALPEGELALARDRVVTALSAASFSQLQSSAGRDKVKQSLMEHLQDALPDYEVTEVLFTSFAMQ